MKNQAVVLRSTPVHATIVRGFARPANPSSGSIAAMIESISAITLATHNMSRAVGFYRMLGFEIDWHHVCARSRLDPLLNVCVCEVGTSRRPLKAVGHVRVGTGDRFHARASAGGDIDRGSRFSGRWLPSEARPSLSARSQ